MLKKWMEIMDNFVKILKIYWILDKNVILRIVKEYKVKGWRLIISLVIMH